MDRLPVGGRWAIAALLLSAWAVCIPAGAHAQRPPERNMLQLEFTFLSGSVSYARRTGDRLMVGGGVGFGPVAQSIVYSTDPMWEGVDPNPDDEFDESVDAAEFADLHGFIGYLPSEHFQLDVGLRLAPFVWSRGAGNSDASFALFSGAYLAPRVGWRRFKIGPRVQFGILNDAGNQTGSAFTVIVTPLVGSLHLGW